MKKLLFLLLVIIFANYGCGNKSVNPGDNNMKPVIVKIDPMSGKVNDHITITGIHLGTIAKQPTIYIGSKDNSKICNIYSINSKFINDTSKIECIIPKNAQTGKIIITSENGETTSNENFLILDSNSLKKFPYLYSISPMSGMIGDKFTIKGKNLGSSNNQPKIYFGPSNLGKQFENVSFNINSKGDTT